MLDDFFMTLTNKVKLLCPLQRSSGSPFINKQKSYTIWWLLLAFMIITIYSASIICRLGMSTGTLESITPGSMMSRVIGIDLFWRYRFLHPIPMQIHLNFVITIDSPKFSIMRVFNYTNFGIVQLLREFIVVHFIIHHEMSATLSSNIMFIRQSNWNQNR